MKRYLIAVAVIVLAMITIGCNRQSAPSHANQPGAAENAKVGKPTIVAKGKTIEQHVTDYFEAYKEQRLEDAFNLAPAQNKAKQPLDQFVAARKEMPISSYKILPTRQQGNQAMIAVEYNIGQFGTWVSSWLFEKKNGKWIAVSYKADPK